MRNLLPCFLFIAACVPETRVGEARGKWQPGVDGSAASCAGHCGARSPDRCFCDDACAGWGDCCPDYAPVCSSGGFDGGVASVDLAGPVGYDAGPSYDAGYISYDAGYVSYDAGPVSYDLAGDNTGWQYDLPITPGGTVIQGYLTIGLPLDRQTYHDLYTHENVSLTLNCWVWGSPSAVYINCSEGWVLINTDGSFLVSATIADPQTGILATVHGKVRRQGAVELNVYERFDSVPSTGQSFSDTWYGSIVLPLTAY